MAREGRIIIGFETERVEGRNLMIESLDSKRVRHLIAHLSAAPNFLGATAAWIPITPRKITLPPIG